MIFLTLLLYFNVNEQKRKIEYKFHYICVYIIVFSLTQKNLQYTSIMCYGYNKRLRASENTIIYKL